MELMHVPTKLLACLESTLEEHRQGFDAYEIHYHPDNVEKIAHKGYDGFIPFTNGGYELSFMSDLSLASGSGSHSKVIQPYIESCQKDALEYFKQENTDFDETNSEDQLWNEFYEYESNYLCESSEFWYQLRVIFYSADNYRNVSGKDEILVISGTNTDFTYGRDSGLQIAFEKNLIVDGLTCKRLVDTLQDAINAI